MIGRLISLGLASLGLAALVASASADSDALLALQERAKYLNDFKGMLQHSDASIRMAALEQALKGDDAALRTMALDTALESDDVNVKTTALRWILRERDSSAWEWSCRTNRARRRSTCTQTGTALC